MMEGGWLFLSIVLFGSTFWLGLYLLAREGRSTVLHLAGLGTVAYALVLALGVLAPYASGDSSILTARVLSWLLAASLFFWLVAFGYLLWGHPRLRAAYNTLTTLLLVGAFVFVTGLALGLMLILYAFQWMWLALGIVILVFGLSLARMDASAKDEALLPDLFRSYDYALFTALFFGGQVAVAMVATGVTFPMLALLLTTTATAILAQVFAGPIQTAVEAFAFARFPQLRQARAELRAAADALPRVELAVDLGTLDDAEFARLTRRALSHFGDLPRLATNPLVRLPVIEQRLAERGAPDNVLERAAELKSLLTESIARLKPRQPGDFAPADEWRHYNALYFPYVAGLKPYSLRAEHDHLDPAAQTALDWFRASVPERTLRNWQTAAAKLVAQDLRASPNGHER